MVHLFVVPASNSEADGRPHVVHDLGNACAQFRTRHIDTYSLVATADVVADAGRADRILVRDYAADGHAIADVVVGHERDLVCRALANTNLVQSALVGL